MKPQDCSTCAFANHCHALPASHNEPAEPAGYLCTVTGEEHPEGQTPQDCPEFAWTEALSLVQVSDVWV